MHHDLQSQRVDVYARIALTRRVQRHRLQRSGERAIEQFDRFQHALTGRAFRHRSVHEDGISLDTGHLQRRLDGTDHGVEQLGDDAVGVLQLALSEELRVTRDVCDYEVAAHDAPPRHYSESLRSNPTRLTMRLASLG